MPHENGSMISANNVDLYYDDFQALYEVVFEAKAGEMIGLIGPNGCGKSTLLRTINGMLKPSGGTIYVDGKDIHKLSLSEIAKTCSNVPTEFPPDFNLSVLEVVMMGRYPHRKGIWWETPDDELIAREALRKFEIDHLADRNINRLSSGERQRTLIAKAYVQEPRVMLVDEPTAHLDMRYKLEVMEYLRDLMEKEKDMTVIIASHDINLMVKYCDKIILVKEGHIVGIGKPEEIVTEENIAKVYGVQCTVYRDGDGEVIIHPKHSLRLHS
ncbi:MAG: iron complex transport system ATP-binding protein [Candidatus Methanomethylophilaceae archaeon]|nr:iron complex transport system ATP-binding protein [Candidatus Methanomethylophilaceae archaeon]